MDQSGICPKCKSERVVPMVANESGLMWPKTLRGFRTRAMVCVDCGFSETYVREKDMPKLQALWQKKLGPKGPIIR